ncbi:unnamed protein product [Adineta ricciae]|uniref:RRM domain-containing protein n=1 Tax=Adineta ricciae TaxID=249248 RepID=A0A813X032_ADIRI|nr:unnamed protein product [Adineta ricciae]
MSLERDESEERQDSRSPRQGEYFVRLYGLSSSASKEDVKKFLSPCHVTVVHLFDINHNNTSSLECLVELEFESDVKDALKRSGECIDRKEIEVRSATIHEYNVCMKHKDSVSWHEPVVRMSGLPISCTMGNVQNFFKNIEIARNGIYITRDMADQALGNGFVAFVNMDSAYKAIDMHDQKFIEDRCIELFPSTYDEAKLRIMNDARINAKQFVGDDDIDKDTKMETNNHVDKRHSRSRSRQHSRSASRGNYRQRDEKRRHSPSASPPSRSRHAPRTGNQRSYNSNSNHRYRRSRSRSPARRSSSRNEELVVKIRGMPYTVVEEDVLKFFPSTCRPSRVEIIQDRRMKRPNGDGYVYFNTIEEVDEAMKCDRKYMGSRYVELYFDSPRYATLTNRRKKPDSNPRRSSRSPSRSRYNRRSRSRSDSMD